MSALLLQLLLACNNDSTKDPADENHDFDGDGFTEIQGDCNDETASIHPDADELCDGVDQNCDGQIDEGAVIEFYIDTDQDGFGDDNTLDSACEIPEGRAEQGGDCDDSDENVYPDAPELCDELDNDCDSQIDEEVEFLTYYPDEDEDGYGVEENSVESCNLVEGHVTITGDCDDENAEVNPDATEICDDIDNDCDSETDEDLEVITYYIDSDEDLYGSDENPVDSCEVLDGYVTIGGDCNDSDSAINPDAAEICDDIDNDCDTQTDEDLEFITYYLDDDSDQFGTDSTATDSCTPLVGYATEGGDCNDDPNNDGASFNPDIQEICDGEDNDCDGDTDDDDSDVSGQTIWYFDADTDNYGNPLASTETCFQPTGYVDNSDDCDDTDEFINPDGTEVCDGEDNDCAGGIDDADPNINYTVDDVWYIDGDSDNYGVDDSNTNLSACDQPANYVDNSDDCDDTDGFYNPDTIWYSDADGDGYGYSLAMQTACVQPTDYVLDDTDCNDTDAQTNEGAKEICGDGIDQDCDSATTSNTCGLSLADADAILRGDADSFFGKEVDLVGTVTGGAPLVAISANRGDAAGPDAGSVYLFNTTQLSGEMDPSDAIVSIHHTEDTALFGVTVVGMNPEIGNSSADLNNDGSPDFAVAATKADDSSNTDAGKIYIFHGGLNGTLDAEADASAILIGEAASDEAGSALDIGDINNDGIADLLVGAQLNDNGASAGLSGAAYLLFGPVSSGNLSGADVKIYGDDASDYFGNAILNTGDMNGDGINDVAIAAYRDDPIDPNTNAEISNAGIVYLFFGPLTGTPTTADADLVLYGDVFSAYVGRDISRAGDMNGDGFADILVGARNRPTNNLTANGTAFLISGDSALPAEMWVDEATAQLDGENHLDEFSRSATSLGDIDGDGFDDIAVGSKGADNGGADSGAAYLYYGPLVGLYGPSEYHGILAGEVAGDNAGISIANLGDTDNNGSNDLMVGGYWNSTLGNQNGAAYFVLGESLIP